MAVADYQKLLERFNAAAPMRRSRQVGSGESSFLEEYTDANSRVLDGQEYVLDPATGQLRTATGSIQSGGITTTLYNADGTTSSQYEEGGRRSFGARLGQAFMGAGAGLAAGTLLATAGAGLAGAAGAAGGGGAAAGAAGAGAAGAGGIAGGLASLATPTNALIGASLLSSTLQARQQANAMNEANAANERIAADQAAAAERTRADAEAARQRALAAGGSAPSRTPDGMASARRRNGGGSGSTMLTGAGGVAPSLLSLSGPSLLGRLA